MRYLTDVRSGSLVLTLGTFFFKTGVWSIDSGSFEDHSPRVTVLNGFQILSRCSKPKVLDLGKQGKVLDTQCAPQAIAIIFISLI